MDSVVRKHLGYSPYSQPLCRVRQYASERLLDALSNDHRSCFLSPETRLGEKGRQRRLYRYDHVNTPYERLKSIPTSSAFSSQF